MTHIDVPTTQRRAPLLPGAAGDYALTRRTFVSIAALAALVVGFTLPADAATEGELKRRFKDRYPALLKAKQAGHIGETTTGYVALVEPDKAPGDAKDLVKAENADRKELYELIAAEEQTDVDTVAKRNALRNYQKARPGEYLQKPDGSWGKKKG